MAIDPLDGEALLPGHRICAGNADEPLVVLGLEQMLPDVSGFYCGGGTGLDGVASERFDFRQVVEKRSHLLQIQVLGITQRPGAEIAAKLGVCRQAVFKHFVALAESGAHFRQVMLRQHGASDLHPGLFQLYVKVDPGLVVDGAVVSDDLQFMRRFEVVVIGIAELLVNEGHVLDHLGFLRAMGDSTIPSIGVCDVRMKLVKVLDKSFSYLCPLRHQLHVCGCIAVGRSVRSGNQLTDTVHMLHQTLLDQADSPHRALGDDPGAATLKVFDLHALSAMAEQHQFFKVQVLGLCKVDVVHAGDVGVGSKGLALVGFEVEVVLQGGVGAAGLGFESSQVSLGRIGQGQLPAQGPIRPPARQHSPNGRRPQRVQAVGHVPEHCTAADTAPGSDRAVYRVVGVPVAGLVEGDRLFVRSCARCA
ncbi:hypothetical protein D3C84_566140 [compost metagenome]